MITGGPSDVALVLDQRIVVTVVCTVVNTESRNRTDLRTAARIRGIPPSATIGLSEKVAAAAARGRPVLNLAGGDPDADTPPYIVDAAVRALRSGRTHYAPGRGTPELRAAIADTGLPPALVRDPVTEILITGSAKLALSLALDAVVEVGDEVIVLSPAWVSYGPLVRLRGGSPVDVVLRAEDGYRLTEELLRAAVSPRTVAIVVNSPNNPTGRVLDQGEIHALTQVAEERDLIIISDEVYARLVFEGEHRSPAAVAPGRTIVVDGLSKGFAMTGWRLGWLHGPADLIAAAALVFEHTVSCAPPFIQDAATVALTSPRSAPAVAAMVETYRRRRDVVVRMLSGCLGIRVSAPQGAFYLFPQVSDTGLDGSEFSRYLMDEAGVAVLPGVAFGDAHANHVRLSLATPDEILFGGVQRLRAEADALVAAS